MKTDFDLSSVFAELSEAPKTSDADKSTIENAFADLLFEVSQPRRGRPRGSKNVYPDEPLTRGEISRRQRNKRRKRKIENIAVLDFETDPFDNVKRERITPFAACLYADAFDPVVIWEENFDLFLEKVFAAIEALPEPYTIYAHNGGKFDFMFLMKKLRGAIKFKGRGIMSAMIGEHELRDSFHIIPERLANFKKDDFDYSVLYKHRRNNFRKEICDYMVNDCRYLLDILKTFVGKHGFVISIGQAAMKGIKKNYKIERLGAGTDAKLRQYFFGGRTQCLAGRGDFVSDHRGDYKLYDMNSQYPFVMATLQHPIGVPTEYRTGGSNMKPNPMTYFLRLTCRNYGALVSRDDDDDVTTEQRDGEFFTTIWEYRAALELGLIENVKIKSCIDFINVTNFSEFVLPRYQGRQETKRILKELRAKGDTSSAYYNDILKDDICLKLELNNAYGKFAQDPTRYKDYNVTDPGECPEIEWFGKGNENAPFALAPEFECDQYWIWTKPAPGRHFNNVATAASITGAARAALMRGIAGAIDPIYCDTDSIICRAMTGVEIDTVKLGAWKLEETFDELIIAGKKLYAAKVAGLADCAPDRIKVRSKGTQIHPSVGELRALKPELIEARNRATWLEMDSLLQEQVIERWNKAPTFDRYGGQDYIKRRIRATADVGISNIVQRGRRAA